MNEEEMLQLAESMSPTPDYTAAAQEAESKDQLTEQVEQQDQVQKDKQKAEEDSQGAYGWSTKKTGIRDLEVDADMSAIAEDPRSATEYFTAPATGVLDTLVGAYNMVMPGYDLPTLPKYQNEGAQLVRDLSSIVIPGMGMGSILAKGGKAVAAARSGRLGAFLRDPFVAWAGSNAANIGGGAVADLAAPVQGDVEGQTALGTIKETFPTWMGWIPDDLVVQEGDNTDTVRLKNITEGGMFGAVGGLIEGLGQLSRGLRGMDSATKYVPKNELADQYFAKNQPTVNLDVDETVDNALFKVEGSRAEIGDYNTYLSENNIRRQQGPRQVTGEEYFVESNVSRAKDMSAEEARALYQDAWNNMEPDIKAQYDQLALNAPAPVQRELIEESIIFGKDDILFSPAENGIRSVDDMGIVGAAVDVTRIDGNIETVYGRIRNPMSEAALKFSLSETGTIPRVMYGLGDQLRLAGDFDYVTTTGKYIDNSKIKNTVDRLTAEMMDMNPNQLKSVLRSFTKIEEGLPVLDKTAEQAVKRTLNKTLKDLADLNQLRAYALTEGAMAGQVSDFAMQMRLNDGTEGMLRTQEQMLDRIEFLMDLRGTTTYAKNKLVQVDNLVNKITGLSGKTADQKYARKILDQMTGEYDASLEALELIQADTRGMMQSLRQLSVERPLFLKPLAIAYELTDGNVRSVSELNNYLRHSTGVIRKAFVDGNPEIPSVIMQGFHSTMFNSALSGAKTPIKAAAGNLSTWVFKPSAHVIGAFMQGNRREMDRAMYAYGSVMDTINNAGQYMKQMWVRSAQDPTAILGRDEIVYKTEAQMDLFKATADAAAAEGNDGPTILYEIMKNQKDLAEHPWLRIGNRTMGTQDAWLQAVNGQMIARMRAYDKVTQNGLNPFSKADADKAAKEIYNQMFDEKGIIKDEQTLRMTADQTFSADNPISKGFQEISQRIPGLKPFLMFTRTPVNSLKYGASFQPVGAFIDKTKKFDLPFDEQPFVKVERLLQEEGIDIAKVDPQAEYTRLRNEYKGRAALGASFVMLGVYGYLSGNITGRAGLYDRTKQQARVKQNQWKPMTAFGVYYGDIPAVSDWLALTVDVLDNANSLQSYDVEETLRALGHIIGANISERTTLQNVEQFSDVLSGNPASIQRWASNVTFTSQFKVAGALGTMNQLMSPQLKAVENNFYQLLSNRIPGKTGLPDKYDWIDGGKVNELGNPLHRIYNALSPFAYHERPSEVKEYLSQVEWNGHPGARSRSDGVPYTKAEQEQINQLMGEDGYFRKEVKRIMKAHPAEQVRKLFFEARSAGLSPAIDDIDTVHNQLDMALVRAKARAELKLPELMAKKREEATRLKGAKAYVKRGDIEGGIRFLNDMQNQSY